MYCTVHIVFINQSIKMLIQHSANPFSLGLNVECTDSLYSVYDHVLIEGSKADTNKTVEGGNDSTKVNSPAPAAVR